jgi:hypothetical protein
MMRAVAVILLLSVAMFASVAQAAAPTITRVVGDLSSRTLIITGTQLPTGRNHAVTLGGVVLSVISRSSTRIVATLPAGVGAGTYPLHIQAGPEIDVTLTGSNLSAGPSMPLFFMGNTTDVTTGAGTRKWLPPVGYTDSASRLSVGAMAPGPNLPVTVHTLRVKKFSLDGLAPAVGNIVVSVVAQRDNDTMDSMLPCTIMAGQNECISVGSIDLLPGANLVINVIHSANEDPSSLAWNFQVVPR